MKYRNLSGTPQQAMIGLGANIEKPAQQIKSAIQALSSSCGIETLRISSLYESKAIGPTQPNFINAVAEIRTRLKPEALLSLLHQIEDQHGRTRKVHWGPRTLDLDIILYGQRQIHSKTLIIPHAQMLNRSFVLVPLLEIAPQLILPDGIPLATHITPTFRSEVKLISPPPKN